jgi:hypothetical protein
MFVDQEFYVLTTQFMGVFMDLKIKSDFFSVYSINWFAFITETECVYCAVRTEPLLIIQVTPSFFAIHKTLLSSVC